MLLSAVSVLVVAQSSSEIPEGFMNNPVYETATDLLQIAYSWAHLRAPKVLERIRHTPANNKPRTVAVDVTAMCRYGGIIS